MAVDLKKEIEDVQKDLLDTKTGVLDDLATINKALKFAEEHPYAYEFYAVVVMHVYGPMPTG